jgi:hypothetical protein
MMTLLSRYCEMYPIVVRLTTPLQNTVLQLYHYMVHLEFNQIILSTVLRPLLRFFLNKRNNINSYNLPSPTRSESHLQLYDDAGVLSLSITVHVSYNLALN